MTSLPHRPNTARVVVDMQRKVVADAYDVDRVVANIATLVMNARAEHSPLCGCSTPTTTHRMAPTAGSTCPG